MTFSHHLLRLVGFAMSALLTGGVLMGQPQVPAEVSFPATDGSVVFAHLYEGGAHGVVLAHGGVFDKESWADLAGRLQKAGLTVVAIDFRGYGKSGPSTRRGGLKNDVLGALTFLEASGVARASIVGGSMGAAAAMGASAAAGPKAIERLILLAQPPTGIAADLQAEHILFVVSEGDPLLESVQRDFEATSGDKRLEVLPGSAHAQHIFKTGHAERLANLIVGFLTEK